MQSYIDKPNYYLKTFFNFQPCQHKCNGHGTCQKTGQYPSNFYCLCKRGYEGETCGTLRQACDLAKSEGNACQNGGYCQNGRDPFDYSCNCPPGWKGKHCEMQDVSSVPFLFQIMKRCSLLMSRQFHSTSAKTVVNVVMLRTPLTTCVIVPADGRENIAKHFILIHPWRRPCEYNPIS